MVILRCSQLCNLFVDLLCRVPLRCITYIWQDPVLLKIAVLYLVTFFIALPLFCHKLPHSSYAIKTEAAKEVFKNELKAENSVRTELAYKYFAMLNRTGLHSALDKQSGDLDIFISVVTVSRNRHKFDAYEPKYLTQVIWKLLENLHVAIARGMKRNVKMAVCNVDMDPTSYREAEYLSNFVPVVSRHKRLALSMEHPLEKEKQDYVFCLNVSAVHKPKYALVIEDDALPHEDFFQVLDHMLRTQVEHSHDHFDNGLFAIQNNVTFIKLYHPERLLGYVNLEPDRLPELFGIAALFGTILYKFFSCLFLNSSKTHYAIWCLLGIYTALVAIAIGRAHLVELRRTFSPYFYTYVAAPECCTPAMVYPYDGAMFVVDYLNHTKCGRNFGKDMALEKMRRDLDLNVFMVQPSLVTHIGLYSSLRNQIVDPFVV